MQSPPGRRHSIPPNHTPDSPSPWSALLQDNLNADDVAGFLSSAIARKEAVLLGGERTAGTPSARSSARQLGGPGPTSRPLSTAQHREPPSADRRGPKRSSVAASPALAGLRHGLGAMRAELEAYEPAVSSRNSSRPGSPTLERSPDRAPPPVEGLPPPPPPMPEGGYGGKRSMAQMQGWMVKAQQSEVAAREEARRFQAQLERSGARHSEELASSLRAHEELRSQLELRQFALQHATEARDAQQLRADKAERELEERGRLHSERLAAAEAEMQRQAAVASDLQGHLQVALGQASPANPDP